MVGECVDIGGRFLGGDVSISGLASSDPSHHVVDGFWNSFGDWYLHGHADVWFGHVLWQPRICRTSILAAWLAILARR